MGRWILPVLIVLMASPRPAVAEAPPPAPPPAAVPEFRYTVEPGESVPGDDASMTVDFALGTTPGAPLQFLCRIKSDTFMPDAWIRMQVIDQHGKTVYETPLEAVVRQGYNLYQFLWDADKVPFGVYSARFVLMRGSEYEEAHCSMVVSKLAEAPLAQRIEEAVRRVDDLTRHLEALSPSGPPTPYARIRLAVAQDFAERARSAFAREDWKRAGYYAGYAANTADSVRIHLTLMSSFPELFKTVPEPPLADVRSRDGGFYAAGKPVFLAGWRITGDAEAAFRSLRRYGLNFAALEFQPAAFQPGPVAPADEWAAQRRALDLAEDANVSVAALLSPFEVAGSETLPIDLIDPDVRESVATYLRTAGRVLRNEPMISGVAIVQKPAFQFTGPEVRDGFIQRLHELYPDVRALNLVWKARLRDIDDVEVDWEPGKFGYHIRPSFQYDWQTYHQWLATGFLAWMQGQVTSQAPTAPTFVEFSDDVLTPGETRIRPDRSAVAPMMDLTGCAVADSPLDPVYAMRYPHASLLYTLLKSLAPEKALVNTEHVLIRPDDPYGRYEFSYVHSALWEGAMSGLNGSALSGWAPGSAVGLQGTFLDRPECVEGYATANRDLNRLADLVAAFQRMPARVAILWSMPAKIYEDGEPYLGSVVRAFEGCSFAGQKLRFITEEQIEAGELESVDVLVMPNLQVLGDRLDLEDRPYESDAFDRVKAYIDGGGVVIRTGNPISADARGRSHGEIIVPTERTILVRGTETAGNYLDAMDAAYAMGALPPTPRAVNEFGYPVEGVRTLFTEIGGVPYLYMLNLRKEPVMCDLEGHYRGGRDLIRGDRIDFPFAVPSLSPMLIRLDAVDLSDVVPTARVGETPAPPERVPRPEGVPGKSPEPYPAASGSGSTGRDAAAASRLNRPGPE